jgi:LmbE family N-acetylglucosaminyl deacetylase
MTGKRLLAVLAHPDDESLGLGGTLARYASEGVQTYLVTATPGDRGRFFDDAARPSNEEVGRVRAAELHAAASVLGIGDVSLLGYGDGRLDQADPLEVASRIADTIRRARPQVVITFGPDGAYGHPDHIAISQYTCAALPLAAAPTADVPGEPHCVSKLYFVAWPPQLWELYQSAFKKLVSVVDGEERQAQAWPEWSLTTRIDARAHWRTAWQAIRCHETQLAIYGKLDELTEQQHEILWGDQHYYRVFSLVNGGRQRETDLFEGVSQD